MFTIAIINVTIVVMLKIDKIYLGGSLRKEKLMKSKKQLEKIKIMKEKSSKAEKSLRNYIQKKYGKIDIGLVSQSISEDWTKEFYEKHNIQRICNEK